VKARTALRRLVQANDDDRGSAIIEFVFVAVIVLVPLVYLIVAVATVQNGSHAVSQAAREAGRAYATADSEADGEQRATVAVRLALADSGRPDTAQLRFVAVGAGCSSAPVNPTLTPGAEYEVCVTQHCDVPAVPSFLQGRGITVVGRYEVHIDDYRVDSGVAGR
jgi:Flp pilus assembly protein TadG